MNFSFTKLVVLGGILLSSSFGFSQESPTIPTPEGEPAPLPPPPSYENPPSIPEAGQIPSYPPPQTLPTPNQPGYATQPPVYSQQPYNQQPNYLPPNYSYQQPPVYVTPAPVQTVYPQRIHATSFPAFRVGMEFNFILPNDLWNGENSNGYFSLGGEAKILLGVHPRLAIELAGSVTGNENFDGAGNSFFDPALTAGLRVYLHPDARRLHTRRIAPYLVGAVGIDFARLLDTNGYLVDASNYFMYQAGGGLEYRFAHERWALNLDLRFVGQNRLNSESHIADIWTGQEIFSQTRYGLRGSAGFSFYFN